MVAVCDSRAGPGSRTAGEGALIGGWHDAAQCNGRLRSRRSRRTAGCSRRSKSLSDRKRSTTGFLTRPRSKSSDNEVTIGVANPFLLNWMQHRFRPGGRRGGAARSSVNRPRFALKSHPAAAGTSSRREAVSQARAARGRTGRCPPIVLRHLGMPRNPDSAAGTPAVRHSRLKPHAKASPCCVQPAAPVVARPITPTFRQRDAARPLRRDRPLHRSAGRRFADLADFVKGPGNELALTAVLQICEQPGSRYNPLVLYGGVGNGKDPPAGSDTTDACGQATPRLSVLFLSAEGFANYFTQALRDRIAAQLSPAVSRRRRARSSMTSISSTASA